MAQMAVQFDNVGDLKRQPGLKGFPVPMAKQMAQGKKPKSKVPRRRVRFPKP